MNKLEKLQEQVDQLEALVERLERRVFDLENDTEEPQFPMDPFPGEPTTKCPACQLEWKGVMGYVCNRSDCPMQIIVTNTSSG